MRVVLDTNILISALLVQSGTPGAIYKSWAQGAFALLTCGKQLEELRRTLRKPVLAERIRPHSAGRLINDLRSLAVMVDPLPLVKRSSDHDDDFLLAAAEAGKAHYLVTGDKLVLFWAHHEMPQKLVHSVREGCMVSVSILD